MSGLIQPKTALVTVTDKDGIVDFSRSLKEYDIEIISTGGTGRLLGKNNVPYTKISDYTGMPEMMDGRLKTLHPKSLGGILADGSKDKHVYDLKNELGGKQIEMVVCNLYDFEKTARGEHSMDDLIENIDIGGPTNIRSAAKNYKHVLVVTNPGKYPIILEEMDRNDGGISLETRIESALEAFKTTAIYDSVIYTQLQKESHPNVKFPDTIIKVYQKVNECRYGENKHQDGAFYSERGKPSIADAGFIIQQKEFSYNNHLDGDSGLNGYFELKRFMERNKLKGFGSIAFKHTSPTGACWDAEDEIRCLDNTLYTDKKSVFGGIITTTFPVTEEIADHLNDTKIFFEVLMAPGYAGKALDSLKKGGKNRRFVDFSPLINKDKELHENLRIYGLQGGGTLFQDYNTGHIEDFNVVSKIKPTEDDLLAIDFASIPDKLAKSNSAVFVKPYYDERRLLGIKTLSVGAGQQSRDDVINLAGEKGKRLGHDMEGSIMITDSFLPFRDGMDSAKKHGAKTVSATGGSIRDKKVIKAANQNKQSFVHIDKRDFNH